MKRIKIAQWGGSGSHILYLPLHIADRLGLFAAQDLDVSIYNAGNDDRVFAELAEGRAHFAVGDPAFVALGKKQGHDTRVIASIVNTVSMWGITPHVEIKPFAQISDFVSLRVGSLPKPSTTHTMLTALKARNPRLLKSTEIIETGIDQQAYSLASNQVDLILELEPMVSAAVAQGLHVVCSLGDFYPEFLFTGLMTSAALIEKSPDVVDKIVRAVQQALTLCHTQHDKVIKVAQDLIPSMDSAIMTMAVERMLSSQAWPQQAIISKQAWTNALKLRQDSGELETLPAFDTVVDERFAYAALAG